MTESGTKLFDRRQLPTGRWLYANREEQSFCRRAVFYFGFDLPGFDTFLESCIWESQKATETRIDLLEKRAAALNAYISGNLEVVRAWLNFLECAWHHILRDEYVTPLARVGKASSEGFKNRSETKARDDIQSIGKRLWGAVPNASQETIFDHDEIQEYLANNPRQMKGRGREWSKDVVIRWLREIDPRPPETRKQAPRKIRR